MGTLADLTKSFAHYTSTSVEHVISTARSLPKKAGQLPREISHLPKDIFVATHAAEAKAIQQMKQLKAMAAKRAPVRAPASQPAAIPNKAITKAQVSRPPVTTSRPHIENKPAHRLITVQVRSATAQLPGGALMEKAGFYHQWMDSYEGNTSAGMGNLRGVPGENGQTCPDLPLSPTQVVSHQGREFKKSKLVGGIRL